MVFPVGVVMPRQPRSRRLKDSVVEIRPGDVEP